MIFACASFIVLVLAAVTTGQSFTAVDSDISSLMATFTNMYAAAVVTQDTIGYRRVSTGASGFANPLTQTPMMLDSSVSGNTVGEVFVAMLTLKLVKEGALPGLDQSIPTNLMPCAMTNPFDSSSFLTLRQLLSHTSRLVDDPAKFQTTTASVSESSALSLRNFVRDFFAVQSATGFSCSSGIFNQALSQGAYSYSRANVLLLSFIIESVLSQNLNLVSSSEKTIAAYMQEAIFNVIGLDGTYFLLPDGSSPRRSSSTGVFYGQFDQKAVQEMSSATSVFGTRLYQGYTADFMLRTSASDLAKLTRSLFIDSRSAFFSIGQEMQTWINASDSNRVRGMVQQGLGIIAVSGEYVCSQRTALLGPSLAGCSVATGNHIGLVASGRTSSLSSLCATAVGTTVCVSAVVAYTTSGASSKRAYEATALASTGATSTNALYALAASSANNVLISPLLTQGNTIEESDQGQQPIFGFEVFIAVLLTFVAVLALAYFSEYFIQPVPLVGSFSTKAYPTLSEHIDRSMNAIS